MAIVMLPAWRCERINLSWPYRATTTTTKVGLLRYTAAVAPPCRRRRRRRRQTSIKNLPKNHPHGTSFFKCFSRSPSPRGCPPSPHVVGVTPRLLFLFWPGRVATVVVAAHQGDLLFEPAGLRRREVQVPRFARQTRGRH